MGRKTFLSIGKPLPGRETIVLTRDRDFRADGVHVAHSLSELLAMAQRMGGAMGAHSVIVGGGTEIYAQALPIADRLELTLVHAEPAGDAVFPDWEKSAFEQPSARRSSRRSPMMSTPSASRPFAAGPEPANPSRRSVFR
jgi:dihydrofolate reductase